jgi:thiamine biosynthesis lipoprotein
MGSQMLAAVDSPSPAAAGSLARIPERFAAWERCLTSYSEESELTELNRSQGRPTGVSDVLWSVVTSALQAAQLTGGLVTPAVLSSLDEARRPEIDHGRTTSSTEYLPSGRHLLPICHDPLLAAGAPVAAATVPDWSSIKLDARKRTVLLPEGVSIDLGSIAKGWAADRAVAMLSRHGPALVDVGGDIAVSGPLAGGSHWPIGVSDPLREGEQLDLIMLRSGGVATSGRNYRKRRQDGDRQIISPRAGLPTATDVLSATVVARNAQEAEVAARVALILGSVEGMAWIDARPHLAGLLVLEDGRVNRSELLQYYLYE